jgi:hypothetical protein
MTTLKPCPDCGTPPKVRANKTVRETKAGHVIIQCPNDACPGITHGIIPQYAYSEARWNVLQPRAKGRAV